jgi:diguanylate cyclase (GGDEF)-like protein
MASESKTPERRPIDYVKTLFVSITSDRSTIIDANLAAVKFANTLNQTSDLDPLHYSGRPTDCLLDIFTIEALADVTTTITRDKPDALINIPYATDREGKELWLGWSVTGMFDQDSDSSAGFVLVGAEITDKMFDIGEQEKVKSELLHHAIHDGLTGIYNQAYMIEQQNVLAKNRRSVHSVTAIIFDANDFKHVNDNYGHLIGDEMLKEIAGCLSGHTRDVDIFGRFGGDEFLMLLPNFDNPELVEKFMERLKTALDEAGLPVSFGGATFKRDEYGHLDVTGTLTEADYNLHLQKQHKDKTKDKAQVEEFVRKLKMRQAT